MRSLLQFCPFPDAFAACALTSPSIRRLATKLNVELNTDQHLYMLTGHTNRSHHRQPVLHVIFDVLPDSGTDIVRHKSACKCSNVSAILGCLFSPL